MLDWVRHDEVARNAVSAVRVCPVVEGEEHHQVKNHHVEENKVPVR